MKYKTGDLAVLIMKIEEMRTDRWINYDNDPYFNSDKLTLDCFLKGLHYVLEASKTGKLDWYFDKLALPPAGNTCGPSTVFHHILAKLAIENV